MESSEVDETAQTCQRLLPQCDSFGTLHQSQGKLGQAEEMLQRARSKR